MADQRGRELERRWRESGSVDDRTAWLAHRLRCGELNEDQLALAAGLGDAASGVLLGWPARADAARLARELIPLGPARCARLAASALEAVRERCPALRGPIPPRGLANWLRPTPHAGRAAEALLAHARAWADGRRARGGWAPPVRAALTELLRAHAASAGEQACTGECGPLRGFGTLAELVLRQLGLPIGVHLGAGATLPSSVAELAAWQPYAECDTDPEALSRAAARSAVDVLRAAQWSVRDQPAGIVGLIELILGAAERGP